MKKIVVLLFFIFIFGKYVLPAKTDPTEEIFKKAYLKYKILNESRFGYLVLAQVFTEFVTNNQSVFLNEKSNFIKLFKTIKNNYDLIFDANDDFITHQLKMIEAISNKINLQNYLGKTTFLIASQIQIEEIRAFYTSLKIDPKDVEKSTFNSFFDEIISTLSEFIDTSTENSSYINEVFDGFFEFSDNEYKEIFLKNYKEYEKNTLLARSFDLNNFKENKDAFISEYYQPFINDLFNVLSQKVNALKETLSGQQSKADKKNLIKQSQDLSNYTLQNSVLSFAAKNILDSNTWQALSSCSLNVIKITQDFEKYRKNIENIEKVKGIVSSVILSGSLLSLASQLPNFMSESKDANSEILKGIGMISSQIAELQKQMHERFDQIDNKLNIIWDAINTGFTQISQKLATMSFTLNSIMLLQKTTREDLNELKIQIQTNQSITEKFFEYVLQKELRENIFLAFNFEKIRGNKPNKKEFFSIIEIFINYAILHSNYNASTSSLKSLSNSEILSDLKKEPAVNNLNLLAKVLSNYSEKPPNDNILAPNVYIWSIAANAIVDFCLQYPEYTNTIDPSLIRIIENIGYSVKQKIDNYQKFTAFKTLTNWYRNNSSFLIKSITEKEIRWKKEKGEEFLYIDIQKDEFQDSNYVPEAFRSNIRNNKNESLSIPAIPFELIKNWIPNFFLLADLLKIGKLDIKYSENYESLNSDNIFARRISQAGDMDYYIFGVISLEIYFSYKEKRIKVAVEQLYNGKAYYLGRNGYDNHDKVITDARKDLNEKWETDIRNQLIKSTERLINHKKRYTDRKIGINTTESAKYFGWLGIGKEKNEAGQDIRFPFCYMPDPDFITISQVRKEIKRKISDLYYECFNNIANDLRNENTLLYAAS